MKTKTVKEVTYTDDLGEMDDFDESAILTPEQQKALGLPTPEEARHMRMVRKPARPARINIRLAAETLEGLRARADEAGMPYQTLAASVLHLVATGKLELKLLAK